MNQDHAIALQPGQQSEKTPTKKKENLARRGDSHLYFQHLERPKWADHLRSGIGDQPGQDGENLSLLKIQKKLAGCGGELW